MFLFCLYQKCPESTCWYKCQFWFHEEHHYSANTAAEVEMYRSCLAGDWMRMSPLQVVIIRPGLRVERSVQPSAPVTRHHSLGSRGDWCNWNKILERCLNGGNRNILKSILRANYQESRIKIDAFNEMFQMLVDIAQAIQIIILMIGNYYWAGGHHTITISPPYISTSVQVGFPSSAPALSSYLHNETSGPNGPHSPPTPPWQHIGTTSTNIAQILTSRNKINIFQTLYLNGFHGATPTTTNMIVA